MNRISDQQTTKLMEAAKTAISNAYEPYSNYPVGAAVLTSNGAIITGVNIENASYPAGICAERITLGNAISQGEREISAVAVFSPKGDISPCGICRQFISEFGQEIMIIFQWNNKIIQAPIKEMLPYSFSKEHLK